MQSKLASINIDVLKGVGPKVAAKLAHLGIVNLEDLLFHLPSRYQDRSRILPIDQLQHGQLAQICGRIETSSIQFGKRRSLVCRLSDDSGFLEVRLFYFSMAQKNQFVAGQYLQCFGQVSRFGRNFAMIHPEMIFLKDKPQPQLADGLEAIYPTTEGLQQKKFNAIMAQALDYLTRSQVTELLPKAWLEKLKFPPLAVALKHLHHPPLDTSMQALETGDNPLVQRLAFEELVAQHIALQRIKNQTQSQPAIAIAKCPEIQKQFLSQLPFQLTNAQQRVVNEIHQDMQRQFPMMRLVQGDVGSGKTLVAALSILNAAAQGLQSALMAPTEILAEQHFKTLSSLFEPLDYKVTLVTSKMPAAAKRESLERVASGEALIVIGTHALFQNQVNFSSLGLVVIDEQHRFGVEQRKTLLEKGRAANNNEFMPHQLVMTATPIPRTLAQTAYADLDLSVIDELPPGRQAITTVVLGDDKRQQVIERVKQACLIDGRQAYWVCTLIDESEELQCQAAEVTHQQLSEQLLGLKVGLIHGRMKAEKKQEIMAEFKSGELDLLIATTVIEVGVDVPNASLMIIENPERLGLSQLHQLRGRVGRGDKASHCLLLYHGPLSKNAQQRLQVMRETGDGFVIAEKDLELRGPGEALGTRQTGALAYRFADLVRDSDLLPEVYSCADEIMAQQPKLADALCGRWVKQGEQLSRV